MPTLAEVSAGPGPERTPVGPAYGYGALAAAIEEEFGKTPAPDAPGVYNGNAVDAMGMELDDAPETESKLEVLDWSAEVLEFSAEELELSAEELELSAEELELSAIALALTAELVMALTGAAVALLLETDDAGPV